MPMTVTEEDYGEEFRWWENQETLYGVVDKLVDNSVPARVVVDYFKAPWEFTSWYEQWFAEQIETMADPD
jgi:hypothetical protein